MKPRCNKSEMPRISIRLNVNAGVKVATAPGALQVLLLREPKENLTTKMPLEVPRVACSTIRGATDWLVDDYVRRPDPSNPLQKAKQTVTPMIHCRIGGTVLVCLLPSPPSHRSRRILRDSATFRQRISIGELRGDLSATEPPIPIAV